MDFSNQNESGGTRQSSSEVLCEGKAINRLGSALDLRGLSLIFSSVENIPGVNARAAFTVNSAAVFREDCDIMPSTFGNIKYMPWCADNQMPYDIIDLIERDNAIARLLPELVGASQWLKSEQAGFFGATLFPSLAIVEQIGPVSGSKWDKYLELRPQIIDLEASLAEEFISHELIDALHQRNLGNSLRPVERPLVAQLQAQIVAVLRGGAISTRRMVDCVNYIRQRPEAFPKWHNSATAKLFTPPIFKNRKNAPGYFF